MNYSKLKSFIDIFFALIMLVFSVPILVTVAMLIKWEDPDGPVIFKQQRVGKNERLFTLYKFRSMSVETHREGKELSDSERLFRVGRFIRKMSLDELPQLLNIIRGDMSFIGPRPLPEEYLAYYTKQECKRHNIKPGISGWAQVNGRNNISWEKKFELDVYYTQNISMLFDLTILFMTIKKVFLSADVTEYVYDSTKDLTAYRTENRKFKHKETSNDRKGELL